MSIKERQDLAEKNRLCFNCLYYGHRANKCRFPSCTKCGRRHHEKLHTDSVQSGSSSSEEEKVVCLAKVLASQGNTNSGLESTNNRIMLATAIVFIHDANGMPQQCRAVIDSGAEVSLITSACTKRLKLPLETASCPISVIGMTRSNTISIINAKLSSPINSYYTTQLQFHVISMITSKIPHQHFDISSLKIPEQINTQLADPEFNVPSQIDVLLGAEISYDIFNGHKYTLSDSTSLHHTALGWVLAGKVFLPSNHISVKPPSYNTNTNSAVALLSTKSKSLLQEEIEVENHFLNTVSRNEHGQFVVSLPCCRPIDDLGDSRFMAVQRLFNLEKRLAKDRYLPKEYDKFMTEYLALGHMERVPADELQTKSYYLPHHAVIKSNSLTTKVRVVFDGSAPSRSGISLNDVLSRGPTVQPELFSILLRFRAHRYVLTGDIEMYRQVRVAPSDCNLQRIVYRSSQEDPVVDYRLLTVTYGTKSASFLATRCLSQLANDTRFPPVSRAIADDLLTGASSIDDCYAIYTELCRVLNAAGMPLRKWCSNSPLLLNRIPYIQDGSSYLLRLNDEDIISTLGLTWQPSIDCFRFVFKDCNPPEEMSKRPLLSDISKIFDPLGLLTPVLIKGKIFLQQLWAMKLGWDSPLSSDLQSRWKNFYCQFKDLERIRLPRTVLNTGSPAIELHGFADASQEAYGACVYLKSLSPSGITIVHLFASKSRVAPLKPTTIPRLELSGALLLAELVHNIIHELSKVSIVINASNIILWSDSTIVLSWLTTSKPLKVFVANRVAQILDLTTVDQWRHVPTSKNTADLITRGISPNHLESCLLWWHGPDFLLQEPQHWPTLPEIQDDLSEIRPVKLILLAAAADSLWILEQFSSWTRLLRVTVFIRRFVGNCRCPSNGSSQRITGPISIDELNQVRQFWFLKVQAHVFSDELTALNRVQSYAQKGKTLAIVLHEVARIGYFIFKNDRCGRRLHELFL